MSEYKSPKTPVNASVHEVYNFLGNFNNFGGLMPQQQISNWKSTENECSFTIQGMGNFGLRISEKVPDTRIVMVPETEKKIPINFNLICEMAPAGELSTEAQIRIEADLPAMIAMMAGKPLQNLVNILAQRLQEHFAK